MLFVYCGNPNLDLYRFTLEYEHIRKIRGFSFKKNNCCDPIPLMVIHIETYTR